VIYIESIVNRRPLDERSGYPYDIPSIASLERFEFRKDVTFIVGENGTGKSTFVEALAVCAGFNAEGGSQNFNFSTQDSHSELCRDLRLVRSPYRNKDGYFLRAESFYNVSSEIDRIGVRRSYGGSLHERSHGESFLALAYNRLRGEGLYIFDEPEAALSVSGQLKLLVRMKELVAQRSQFVIATHSPILMAYPGAEIYCTTDDGLELVEYEQTEAYRLTRYFIGNYKSLLGKLGLSDENGPL